MTFNIKEVNLSPIRQLLTYADPYQVVSVSDEDVDNLFNSATTLSFHFSHGVNLKDALHKLDPGELECDKATKALFAVRCSISYPMSVSELANLSQYIDENFIDADVRWGFAIVKMNDESDTNVTVVAATTY